MKITEHGVFIHGAFYTHEQYIEHRRQIVGECKIQHTVKTLLNEVAHQDKIVFFDESSDIDKPTWEMLREFLKDQDAPVIRISTPRIVKSP